MPLRGRRPGRGTRAAPAGGRPAQAGARRRPGCWRRAPRAGPQQRALRRRGEVADQLWNAPKVERWWSATFAAPKPPSESPARVRCPRSGTVAKRRSVARTTSRRYRSNAPAPASAHSVRAPKPALRPSARPGSAAGCAAARGACRPPWPPPRCGRTGRAARGCRPGDTARRSAARPRPGGRSPAGGRRPRCARGATPGRRSAGSSASRAPPPPGCAAAGTRGRASSRGRTGTSRPGRRRARSRARAAARRAGRRGDEAGGPAAGEGPRAWGARRTSRGAREDALQGDRRPRRRDPARAFSPRSGAADGGAAANGRGPSPHPPRRHRAGSGRTPRSRGPSPDAARLQPCSGEGSGLDGVPACWPAAGAPAILPPGGSTGWPGPRPPRPDRASWGGRARRTMAPWPSAKTGCESSSPTITRCTARPSSGRQGPSRPRARRRGRRRPRGAGGDPRARPGRRRPRHPDAGPRRHPGRHRRHARAPADEGRPPLRLHRRRDGLQDRRAGAEAYLSKDAARQHVLDAIAAIARGGTVFAAEAQAGLAAEIRLRRAKDRPGLTAREQQVLALSQRAAPAPDIGRRSTCRRRRSRATPVPLREARRVRPGRRGRRGHAPRPARVTRGAVLGRPGTVLAVIRLATIPLLVLAERLIGDPEPRSTPFGLLAALALVYAVAMLVAEVRGATARIPPWTAAVADLALISLLVYTSGGPFSQLRFAFFILPRRRRAPAAPGADRRRLGRVRPGLPRHRRRVPRRRARAARPAALRGHAGAVPALDGRRGDAPVGGAHPAQSRRRGPRPQPRPARRPGAGRRGHDAPPAGRGAARRRAAEPARRPAGAGRHGNDASLDLVREGLDQAVVQLREAVLDLHPHLLDQAGLRAALQAVAAPPGAPALSPTSKSTPAPRASATTSSSPSPASCWPTPRATAAPSTSASASAAATPGRPRSSCSSPTTGSGSRRGRSRPPRAAGTSASPPPPSGRRRSAGPSPSDRGPGAGGPWSG